MNDPGEAAQQPITPAPSTCKLIDWFSEGEEKVVEIQGVRVVIRFVGRRGRRGRIAIEAPAGSVFRASDPRSM